MKVNYFILVLLTFSFCIISRAQSKTSSVCFDETLPPKMGISKEISFIATKQEKDVFNKLQNDNDRKRFIDLFWRRRDPNPDTAENEYKDEFCKRILYANNNFESGIPGWKTDRGRTYLILGKPDKIEKGRKKLENIEKVPFEKWIYKNSIIFGNTTEIIFFDPTETKAFRFWEKQRETILKILSPTGVCWVCPSTF